MAPLPTIDDFITFGEARSSLIKGQLRCIWYLPDKERRCNIDITQKERQKAYELIQSYQMTGTLAMKDMAGFAQHRCCGRRHRDMFCGSGLRDKLAERWHDELHAAMAHVTRLATPRIKQEHVTVEIRSLPLTPPTTPTRTLGSPGILTPGHDTSPIRTPSTTLRTTPVIFSKRQLPEWDTVQSSLLSHLDPRASKEGFIYFYTHNDGAFDGMIKIGYTSRGIPSRLLDWAECGHGEPKLLESFNQVRHPERVELLIHMELEQCWHALQWCNVHRRSHVEWFRVERLRARGIAQRWCDWMREANPYDRRGKLTETWADHVSFLIEHGCPITAEAMTQIQRIETGLDEVSEFTDDGRLRRSGQAVKEPQKDNQ